MKKLRSWIIAMVLGIMTLMLAGCNAGSSVDTSLTINKDVSGTRVMKIAIVESVFAENFNGTSEDLYALISDRCPEELAWGYEEAEETKNYTFTLDFTSIEDYKTKVASLCGEEKEITINVADSIWSNGVFVQEAFNSKDLLKWLSDALVEAEYVSADHVGKIFSDGATSVSFGEKSANSNANIYWDNIDYLKLNSITVKTEVVNVDIYKMRVDIDVPAASMSAKGAEIREFIDQCVPPLGKMETEEKDGGEVFSIIKEPVDLAGMENFFSVVFGDGNASVVRNDAEVDDSHPFVIKQVVDQKISLRNYMAGNNASARFVYKVKAPENMAVELNNSHYSYFADDDYITLMERTVANEEMDYKLTVTKTFQIEEMTVKTTQKGTDKWEKVTTFQYATIPTQEELAMAVERFESRLVKEEEETAVSTEVAESSEASAEESAEASEEKPEKKNKSSLNVKIKSSDKNGSSITITQKGSSQEIAEGSELLFGRANNIVYASDGGFAKVGKKQAVVDESNYATILSHNKQDNFVMHYSLKVKGIGKITDTNIRESEMVKQKSNSVTADFQKSNVTVEVYGSYTDFLAVLFWILVAAGLLLVLIGVFKSGVLKKKAADQGFVAGSADANDEEWDVGPKTAESAEDTEAEDAEPVTADADAADAEPVTEAADTEPVTADTDAADAEPVTTDAAQAEDAEPAKDTDAAN